MVCAICSSMIQLSDNLLEYYSKFSGSYKPSHGQIDVDCVGIIAFFKDVLTGYSQIGITINE